MTRAVARKKTTSPVAEHLQSYLDFAVESLRPFSHWLADKILPDDVLNDIAALAVAPPANQNYDGTRLSIAPRFYFTPENQDKYFVCREVASIFHDPSVVDALEFLTGTDLTHGRPHIEYCQDIDGFWLDPSLGDPASLLTMEIVLSGGPDQRNAGTELCDDTRLHNAAVCTPREKGVALIFVPGQATWHGLSRRAINGVRKSLIVNYYSPEWKKSDELA